MYAYQKPHLIGIFTAKNEVMTEKLMTSGILLIKLNVAMYDFIINTKHK